MSADILTPDGAAVTLAPPPPETTQTTYPYNSPGPFPYTATGFAVAGSNPDEIVVASQNGQDVVASGYSLDGTVLFRDTISSSEALPFGTNHLSLTTIPGGGVAALWLNNPSGMHYDYLPGGFVTVIGADGTRGSTSYVGRGGTLAAFSSPTGYHLEWVDVQGGAIADPPQITSHQGDFLTDGQAVGSATSQPGAAMPAYANIMIGGSDFLIQDNQAQLAGQSAVTVPGEPAAAITQVMAAGLADRHGAAVAWIDSGTDYVSIYDGATNSFGPRIGLDWGGATDLHLVALPDGGFAASWANGGAYKGEVFDGAGNGGGVMPLTGQFAAIDSHGDLYTVGRDSSGNEVVQTYAINGGAPGGGGGSSVSTSAADYTAPDGVTTITLTGANQTIHANNAGDTIFSNDTGNALYGGTGNDTFYMGRGGDWAQGGGGDDTFIYSGVPWAAGGITDFGPRDVIDLTGALHQAGYAGNDPVGAGYLSISPTVSGAELQIFADGRFWNAGFVEGVSASNLQANGDLITLSGGGGSTAVSTSDSHYVAPANVTSITLTGSQQTIDASATHGVTITSNDTGNVLIGGASDDVFHLGRGGDWVAGGAGADTFAYAGTPWTAGGITDFNAAEGDRIDVSGLLQASGYAGSDPFADGYLKYGTDSSGNAQLWSDVNQPGNTGWWLVATLEGVSTSSLHYANGMIT